MPPKPRALSPLNLKIVLKERKHLLFPLSDSESSRLTALKNILSVSCCHLSFVQHFSVLLPLFSSCLSTVAKWAKRQSLFQCLTIVPVQLCSLLDLCGLWSPTRMANMEQLKRIFVGSHIWELLDQWLYYSSASTLLLLQMFVCFNVHVWEPPTFSSSVISFSDTGEVGLFFMKSLKLLDRCRESWKHTENKRFLIVQYEKSLSRMDGWVDGWRIDLKKHITV